MTPSEAIAELKAQFAQLECENTDLHDRASDLLTENEKLVKENLELRLLLCSATVGSKGYYDDGEMQDNTVLPSIDFKRDSVEMIKNKMWRRVLDNAKQS